MPKIRSSTVITTTATSKIIPVIYPPCVYALAYHIYIHDYYTL